MSVKMFSFGLLGLALVLAGCDSKKTEVVPKPADKTGVKKDDHEHGAGPHDGTIIELGKYHGEFVVDHKKKEATVYILDGDVKNPEPITAKKLSLSIKKPQFQIELKALPLDTDPKDKCSRFVGTHEAFGKEQEFEGTVSGEIDGKPYLGDFKEKPHKD